MLHSRLTAVVGAAVLACAASVPAHANISFTFNLPGQTDSISLITDGDAVGGVVANGKYNILDVIIRSSGVFGAGVVGFSVSGGQLGMNGTPLHSGYDPNANFIYWHGANNRFEVNDPDSNLAGSYASGFPLVVNFLNSLPGYPGTNSSYVLQTWFGGSDNAMYAVRQGQVVGGGPIAVGSVQAAPAAAVPEPAALLLSATALAALLATNRRRPRIGGR